MEFNAEFWNNKYLTHQTGWDLKVVSTPLKAYIDQLSRKDLRILIPGCGNAYEAAYLLEKGFTDVTVIDISDVLVAELKEKFKNYPQLKIINQDFFELEGQFDLILEQTFFCALSPSLRPNYVEKMHELLAVDGRLVGLLFQVTFNHPFQPFGGSVAEYEELFSPKFEFIHFETAYNSIQPRANNELFIHFKSKSFD